MYWAQYILLALIIFELGMALASHGEPRQASFAITLLDVVVILWLLAWGGFFDGMF